jgi:ribosome-associated protein
MTATKKISPAAKVKKATKVATSAASPKATKVAAPKVAKPPKAPKAATPKVVKAVVKPTITQIVIDALEDIKARDIKVIDVRNITSVSDYVAIACGDSNRQTRALAKNVADKLKEAGYHIYGTEGEDSGEWVLVDCGDVVVHIMQPAVRDYYKLEELWTEGKLEFPKPKSVVMAAAEEEALQVAPKKVAAKKVAVKKPAAKKPTAKASTAKKPAAKKPAAKKPVAKKPAAKKGV